MSSVVVFWQLLFTFLTSPLKPLNEIQGNMTGSKISTASTKFVFFWRLEKQDGSPGLWLAEHFLLLLKNYYREFNESWQKARSQCPLPSLCFLGLSEKQDGRPGLWLDETFSTSLKPLNRIQQNWTRSKIPRSSTKFVFWGLIRKTRWTPQPLIGQTFWTSPLKPLKGIHWNLTESKI